MYGYDLDSAQYSPYLHEGPRLIVKSTMRSQVAVLDRYFKENQIEIYLHTLCKEKLHVRRKLMEDNVLKYSFE